MTEQGVSMRWTSATSAPKVAGDERKAIARACGSSRIGIETSDRLFGAGRSGFGAPPAPFANERRGRLDPPQRIEQPLEQALYRTPVSVATAGADHGFSGILQGEPDRKSTRLHSSH